MAKQAVSVTLEESNVIWLKGRGRGNLSAAIDDLVSAARAGRLGGLTSHRSVVGTIDLPIDDPGLEHADRAVRDLFAESLAPGGPLQAAEARASYGPPRTAKRSRRRG